MQLTCGSSQCHACPLLYPAICTLHGGLFAIQGGPWRDCIWLYDQFSVYYLYFTPQFPWYYYIDTTIIMIRHDEGILFNFQAVNYIV